jgi:peptidoglycan/LPS O-acetylase OafA/YrhL
MSRSTLIFPMVDILRGFAALSVVVYHVIAHYNWTNFPISGPLVWFRIGGLGVDLFFVISGFVIALSAFSRLRSARFSEFVTSFARARIARIVPLYYLTCIIFIVFIQPEILFVHDIWKQVLSHAIFLHSWILMHQGGINGVNWSVAVEMQFYMLMMFAAPWLMRARPLTLALGAIAIAWLWRLGVFCFVSSSGQWGTFPVFVYVSQLPGMLDEFAAGILLARLFLSPQGDALRIWARRWPWVLPTIAALVVSGMLHVYWQNSTFWNSGPMVVAFKSLLALAWVTVLLTACTLDAPALIRATAPLRYLGTISYGIYLWHLPVLLALKRVSWLDGPQALPWVICLTLLFASISWHFFEKPLMEHFRRQRTPSTNTTDKVYASA